MPLKIATWNINSLRLRLPLIENVIAELNPDVLCLQETKVPDEFFPADGVAALGFPHMVYRGMKGYNGVAILSRHPISNVRHPEWCGRQDCRHLIAEIEGVDIHSIYIPAGGDVPDPDSNEKFAHKLQFLAELTDWFERETKRGANIVLTGDFNIAPLETDVWSHKQLLKVVSHTPVEVEKLDRLQRSAGWVDAVRAIIPPSEKVFSWWSYRSPDWQNNDRGRRLDHIWVSPALESAITDAKILRPARSWTQPSDHVPVMVELAL